MTLRGGRHNAYNERRRNKPTSSTGEAWEGEERDIKDNLWAHSDYYPSSDPGRTPNSVKYARHTNHAHKTNQLRCIFQDATRPIDSRQDRTRRMEPQKAWYSALAFFVVVLHNQIWLSGYLFKSGEHLLYNFQNRTICPKCQLVVDDRLSVAYTIITI